MAINIIAGSKLWIGTQVAYKDQITQADFTGMSWTEIKPLTALGELSVDVGMVSQDVINTAVTQYRKGVMGFAIMENSVLPDRGDAGQVAFAAAAQSCQPYAFKVERSADCSVVSTVTISNASPAVVTWNNHGLSAGASVVFSTTGTLPTGLTAGTTYYVVAAGLTANSFSVSASPGGAAVNTTGAGTGTHTATAQPLGTTELFFGLALPGGSTGGGAGDVQTRPIRIQPIARYVEV